MYSLLYLSAFAYLFCPWSLYLLMNDEIEWSHPRRIQQLHIWAHSTDYSTNQYVLPCTLSADTGLPTKDETSETIPYIHDSMQL